MNYLEELVARFWRYATEEVVGQEQCLEEMSPRNLRPPVFTRAAAGKNVLVGPELPKVSRERLLALIPVSKRHRWFRSMKSSQALVQSVFGTLIVTNRIHVLSNLQTEDGFRPFSVESSPAADVRLEVAVESLGEPRLSEIDVWVESTRRIAIECKLSEPEVGSCSRPRKEPCEPDYCNGTYTPQKGRSARCPLTEIGVKYWMYVPALFKWDSGADYSPCPLCRNYQLVRNVLAACVRPDGEVSPDKGVAVLIYDERSPAFQPGGKGWEAFEEVRSALRNPLNLQRCTWQELVKCLRADPALSWLTGQIERKYGL